MRASRPGVRLVPGPDEESSLDECRQHFAAQSRIERPQTRGLCDRQRHPGISRNSACARRSASANRSAAERSTSSTDFMVLLRRIRGALVSNVALTGDHPMTSASRVRESSRQRVGPRGVDSDRYAAQDPLRNSVSAMSTFARSAWRTAGQFFSERTSVFHE